MLQFAQPDYLLLALLIPVFFIAYALMRRARSTRIRKIGDPELVKALMPSASAAKGWVRVSLLAVGFLFFAVGLARPQIGAKLKEHKSKGVEIMICLDVSNSMLAQDYSPNRLERAKLAISRIVDKLSGDRIGLIVFAGEPFVQLPITTDYVSAKMFMGSISTETVPVQGTAVGSAINTAIRSFSAQSEKSRAIIVITDGENHEDDPLEAARQAAELGIRVFTIGIGSPEGKPIPYEGGLLRDKDGEIVVTRLDEDILRRVAEAGGGAYVRAGNSEFGLQPIVDSIKKMDAEEFNSIVFEEFDEQYMYFFAIALFFLVIELLVGERKHRRKFFAAAVLLMTGLSLHAQDDRHDVRRGNRDYRREQYREADVDYRKALLKDSASFAASFNLANTQYRLSGGREALDLYKAAEAGAAASGRESDYWFNVGDAAIGAGDWKAAVDAFRRSLLINPGDIDAKENYIYARKMLEDQQQNQDQNQDRNQDGNDGQSQNNQNQQDQDQNKDNDKNNDQDDDRQDQNQDQNQSPDRQEGQDEQDSQSRQQGISPQQAAQMLQAIQAKEKETQDKVNKEKALLLKSRQKDKNW